MNRPTREIPLIRACKNGDLNAVRSLVDNSRAVNNSTIVAYEQVRQGNSLGTPLHAAVMNGNVEVVRFLVQECGANVDAITTPTIPKKSLVIRKFFQKCLPKSKQQEIENQLFKCGNTALHYAAFYLKGQIMNDIVTILIQNGADILIRNNAGKLAWEMSADSAISCEMMGSHKRIYLARMEFIRILFQATKTGYVEDVKSAKERLLDSNGLSVLLTPIVNCSINEFGMSPLNAAYSFGHLDLVRYLIEDCNADVSYQV